MSSAYHLTSATRAIPPHDNWHVLCLGLIFAAADAFGIGSNDVANSFATSVGSGSLTLRRACMIAIFTEFTGAVVLGEGVTRTIKGSIIDLRTFDGQPDTLMLAMLCALVGSSVWVNTATRLGMSVSTTHSIVGATIGVGIAFRGPAAVLWGDSHHGVASIVLSWIVSPLIAGVLGAGIFTISKIAVFSAPDPHARMLKLYPFYVAATFSIVIFFMVLVGAPRLHLSKRSTSGGLAFINVGPVVGVTLALTVLIGGVAFYVQRTDRFRRWVESLPLEDTHLLAPHASGADDELDVELHGAPPENVELRELLPGEAGAARVAGGAVSHDYSGSTDGPHERASVKTGTSEAWGDVSIGPGREAGGAAEVTGGSNAEVERHGHGQGQAQGRPDVVSEKRSKVASFLLSGVEVDVVTPVDDAAKRAHSIAKRYDPHAERLFTAVQVFTASFASLAHGSNDVSNAIAPLSVIQWVWFHGGSKVSPALPTPVWCLVYGAVFIDLGLVLMGYRVMRSLGNNITYHSPSRGFSMELAALTTVLFASATGTSVSTTHCICGATVGVGLCTGDARALNWKMVAWTMCGWLLTLPFAGIVSGLLFAFIAHSPKAIGSQEMGWLAVGQAVVASPGGVPAVGACLKMAAPGGPG